MLNPRKRLRAMLKGEEIIVAPGAFDPLSARIVEANGFPAVYVSGGAISRSWGFPDIGIMTMVENLAFINRICESVKIPVIADADTGYGNALNVVRTVKEYERAGVAGFHLEDQVTPKRCGHYEEKEVVSRGEMVGKIQAALDTRQDSDMLIIARTDARAVMGLDEAIERGNEYALTGADVIFVEAPASLSELQRIATEISAPLFVNMIKGSRTPLLSPTQLQEMGYKIVIYPNDSHRAAIWAICECMSCLRENGTTSDFKYMVDFETRERIVEKDLWDEVGKKYLVD